MSLVRPLLALNLAFVLISCQVNNITPTAVAVTATAVPSPTMTLAVSATAGPAVMAGCTMVSNAIVPTTLIPFPPVSAADWTLGPGLAVMTIIEYGDFQCPYCAQLAPILSQLLKDYPADLRLVYRHFPLVNIHDKAILAAQATEAAGKQGRFWEMHDLLFARQAEWRDLSLEKFPGWLTSQAASLGLEPQRFNRDLVSPEIQSLVEQGLKDGTQLGLESTPSLVINGEYQYSPLSYWSLATAIKLYKLKERQFTGCPPLVIDPLKQYIARLRLAKGSINIKLLTEYAPLAVNSFVFLARSGWYDGVPFHSVIPGVGAQTGDPSGTGLGGPGYAFINEVVPGVNFDRPGLVGLANAGRDSNGSQFFITLAPQPDFNGRYTLFGEVVSGMEVLRNLTPRNPLQDPSLPLGDVILSVTIEEK